VAHEPMTIIDLSRLSLAHGEGKRLEVPVALEPFELAGQTYKPGPWSPTVRLDVSRPSNGFAFRLNFPVHLEGPCMRCLEPAEHAVDVDAREVDQPGAGEELRSPYLDEGQLDLKAWARDALALALPVQIVCREDCLGLCAVCGENLNNAGPDHAHEREPDPRWAALRELKLD
jgi:uncharacterized protein